MKYHLNRRIEFVRDVQYKNLYPWALRELSPEGVAADRDQIPWDWSLTFEAVNLLLHYQVGSGDDGPEVSERIVADLRPFERDGRRAPYYSMFGTDRIIKSIVLTVRKADQHRPPESCTAWGIISYTSEGVDFIDETTDDFVGFEVSLSPENFSVVKEAARENKGEYSALFSVTRVAGFYSDWSPSILTDQIKILLPGADQTGVGSSFEDAPALPRLGEGMRNFSLHLYRSSTARPIEPDRA